MAALKTMVAERDAMEARIVELQARIVQEQATTNAFRTMMRRVIVHALRGFGYAALMIATISIHPAP